MNWQTSWNLYGGGSHGEIEGEDSYDDFGGNEYLWGKLLYLISVDDMIIW